MIIYKTLCNSVMTRFNALSPLQLSDSKKVGHKIVKTAMILFLFLFYLPNLVKLHVKLTWLTMWLVGYPVGILRSD